MGWFDNQIKLRKQNDNQAFDHAFRRIAGAVTRDQSSLYADEEEKTRGAIDAILSYYHVRKKENTDLY